MGFLLLWGTAWASEGQQKAWLLIAQDLKVGDKKTFSTTTVRWVVAQYRKYPDHGGLVADYIQNRKQEFSPQEKSVLSSLRDTDNRYLEEALSERGIK